MNAVQKDVVLGKGVDSLYLYLDTGIEFTKLFNAVESIAFGEEIAIGGLWFTRDKAFMRTYPVSLRHGMFLFYLNRASIYIMVISTAFELRGYEGAIYWLCSVLSRLRGERFNWLDHLLVSRVDVFCDFEYDGDFKPEQFKTKLKARGVFESGRNREGKTYYFGNRSVFCVRLYVKSVEIEKSGKTYLRPEWKERGHDGGKVWRLEFEYRKRKLDRLTFCRNLVNFDQAHVEKLWSYGIDQLQYMNGRATNNNLSKKKLHPVWNAIHGALWKEYRVLPEAVKEANIDYRRKRARTWILSYFIASGFDFSEIPESYKQEFKIDEFHYLKVLHEASGRYGVKA